MIVFSGVVRFRRKYIKRPNTLTFCIVDSYQIKRNKIDDYSITLDRGLHFAARNWLLYSCIFVETAMKMNNLIILYTSSIAGFPT